MTVSAVDDLTDMASLDDDIKQLTSGIDDDCDTGFNGDGSFKKWRHGQVCPNPQMDDNTMAPDFYCAAEQCWRRISELRKVQNRYPMLGFYWNTDGRNDAEDFLRNSGLIMAYWYFMKSPS